MTQSITPGFGAFAQATRRPQGWGRAAAQRGSVLIVALGILTVLALLAVSFFGVAWVEGEKAPTDPSWASGFGPRLLDRWIADNYEG